MMHIQWLEKLIPKGKNTAVLYLILIIGIIALALGSSVLGTGQSGKKAQKTNAQVMLPTDQTEKKLTQILSKIKGAGNVSVMISYESTGEKVFAADTNTQTSQSEDKDGEAKTKSDTDTKQDIKTITPAGAPVVSKEIYPKVCGVIVVVDGGNDAVTRQNIIRAVTALLNVPEHKIGVFASK